MTHSWNIGDRAVINVDKCSLTDLYKRGDVVTVSGIEGVQKDKASVQRDGDPFHQVIELTELKPLADQSFTIKDSGARQEFASGMVRDTADDKTDYELIFNGPMSKRWAEHLTKGQKKYPDPEPGKANWMRASGLEEKTRFRKSAVRHFIQWLNGDTDEDHAAAVFFNINGYEYVKGKETANV